MCSSDLKIHVDMLNGAKFLKSHPLSNGKLGATGFCFGGAVVNYLAVEMGADLNAVVAFYGRQPEDTDVARSQGPPLAHDATGSQHIFDAALNGYGNHLDIAFPDNATPPPLTVTQGNVLLIQMAALLALYGEKSEHEDGILDGVLEHEDRYWRGKAAEAGLGTELHDATAQALALATLAGGCADRDQARALIGTAPEVDGDKKDARAITKLLHELYALRTWLDGVEPDILGEHLVAREAAKSPALLDSFFATATGAHTVHGLIVLVRLLSRKPEALELITTVLDSHGERVFQHLDNSENFGLLMELERHLPHNTTALRKMAARVTQTLLDGVKAFPGTPNETRQAAIARLANNLSGRLGALGRREDALAAIEEAVAIRRELARRNPDAFTPGLASSLNNQSAMLSNLGRHEEALAASDEAVALYRRLAARNPDAFTPGLAMSLNNQSNTLSDLGRFEEALAAIEETVAIRRRLAERNPDAFTPDLANALNNQANSLGELGRHEQALAAIEEAVAIRHSLAQRNPDAFAPDLAVSLGAQSQILAADGQPREALDAITEALLVITPLFLKLPQAFAKWAAMMGKDYLEMCEAADTEPDAGLLTPITEALQKLKAGDG